MEVLRDFVAHYLDFILSPSVFLALALVSPVIFLIYQDSKTPSRLTSRSEVPGCRRFGLAAGEPSYLRDQYSISTRGSHPSTGKVRVKALFTYPVKSGRGVELRVSEVESVGLRYDRLFSFAQLIPAKAGSGKEGQDEWRFITQREFPRLALLSTELWLPDPRQPSSTDTTATPRDSRGTPRRRSLRSIPGTTSSLNGSDPVNDWHANDGCLIIRFPYDPDFNPFGLRSRTVTIRLPLSPTPERAEAKRYQYQELSIWKDRPMAINMSTEIPTDLMAKLKEVLWVRAPLALFRVDDDHHRTVSRNLPEEFADRFKVKLADSYPLHILNLASVRDIDGRLPDRAAFKGRLDARRFRANIYIEGPPMHTEDTWKKVLIGQCVQRRQDVADLVTGSARGEYLLACRTTRCKLPNVDPETGLRDVNEPYTTLGRTRKVEKEVHPHPCLGMQGVPLFNRGIIRVGDELEVIETMQR